MGSRQLELIGSNHFNGCDDPIYLGRLELCSYDNFIQQLRRSG